MNMTARKGDLALVNGSYRTTTRDGKLINGETVAVKSDPYLARSSFGGEVIQFNDCAHPDDGRLIRIATRCLIPLRGNPDPATSHESHEQGIVA